MKFLRYILTAAVVLVGADVFVTASASTDASMATIDSPMTLGESGIPTPPPD